MREPDDELIVPDIASRGMDLDLPRSAASVALLADHAPALGLARDEVLAAAGLAPQDVGAGSEVTGRQERDVLAALARATSDPVGLGIALGRQYHATTYGIVGFALASSRTVREAVDVGLRYLALTFALVDVHLDRELGATRLRLSADHLDEPVRSAAVARDVTAIATLRDDLGADPEVVERVDLALPRPDDAATTLPGDVPVHWAAPEHAIVLDPRRLDRPLPRANAHTVALCEAQCRDLLARRRRREGVAGEVRDRLLVDPARMPDMATIAAERHVTERTLRRQLADEGVGFRALVAEVREALATELLGETGLTVEQTAHRLGYAEPAAFIHAFRRWTGTTPGAWRDAER